jgi:hypothetical protein
MDTVTLLSTTTDTTGNPYLVGRIVGKPRIIGVYISSTFNGTIVTLQGRMTPTDSWVDLVTFTSTDIVSMVLPHEVQAKSFNTAGVTVIVTLETGK